MNSQVFGVECIVSKSNSTIAKIAKLLNKKERKETELFTLDGVKLFLEAHNFGAEIKYIVLNDKSNFDSDTTEKIFSAKRAGANIICVNDAVFSKLTDESAPQGIVTVCKFLPNHRFLSVVESIKPNEKIMLFESVRDPGNVGAILRNAAAFGVDKLIFTADCADIYSQKVVRAAMGAIFKVKIDIVSDVLKTVDSLKIRGRRVIATTLGTNSLELRKDKISAGDVFVIGNEGHGISDGLIKASDETMFIPMCKNTESLNASVAASILMWELFNL